MMAEDNSEISKDVEPKCRSIPSECRICGAPALYKYFGTIACHACKVFFKRNAEAGLEAFKCDFHGDCDINIHNRHICALCRLTKCLTSGMQIEMIRCSRKTNMKRSRSNKRLTTNEQNQEDLEGISNHLNLSYSILTVDQWDIVSNLIKCYNEYNIVSNIQQFIQDQTSLPIKLRYKTSSFDTLFLSILNGLDLFFKVNQSFISLCSHDRLILLRSTMKNAGCFLTAFLHSSDSFQSNETNLLKDLFNIFNHDMNFIKLGLVIFSFSTNNFNIYFDYYENSRHILTIQNLYTEITWKYLISKYNSQTAMKYFIHLIRSFIIINTTIIQIHQSEQYKHIIEILMEKINQQVK